MGRSGLFLLLTYAVMISTKSGASDRFDGWQTGDLIFQESLSPQAGAIRAATGSRYTHMGIIRRVDGDLRVIEASRTVIETPLEAFIARGAGQDYAVYRVSGLTADDALAAVTAARDYYDRPYDIFFRLDPAAIYCSELPFYAFRATGITLGRIERLGDLGIGSPESRALFLARWRDHPDCQRDGLDREACWARIQDQEIVTPAGIAEDPGVGLVFSTFEDTP